MTAVFVTQTGQRYHGRRDLSCLENAHSIAEVDLATAAAGGLLPCLVCDAPALPGVSEGDARWLRTIDDWARGGTFESFWEQAFARRVLAQTADLGSDQVEPQAYVAVGAETYKVDFLIPNAKIVLEIDGYAKDGTGPSPTDIERRNRRDAALQASGYRVLHFSNAQVQQEPAACRAQVSAALASTPASTAPMPPTETPAAPSTPLVAASAPASAYLAPSQPAPPPAMAKPWMWVAGIVGGLALVAVVTVAALSANSGTSTSPAAEQPGASAAAEEASADSAPPQGSDCPPGFPFKGNQSDSGELIVHAPGQRWYDRTDPETCFATLEAAAAAGFRASKQ